MLGFKSAWRMTTLFSFYGHQKREYNNYDFCNELSPITQDVTTACVVCRVRMVSLSTQKFISDIVNDSLQQFKMRQSAVSKKQRQVLV